MGLRAQLPMTQQRAQHGLPAFTKTDQRFFLGAAKAHSADVMQLASDGLTIVKFAAAIFTCMAIGAQAVKKDD